jgi:hypothetical protein
MVAACIRVQKRYFLPICAVSPPYLSRICAVLKPYILRLFNTSGIEIGVSSSCWQQGAGRAVNIQFNSIT